MQGEKPPQGNDALENEERELIKTREELILLRDDIAYLSQELGTFLSTQQVTDESAQALYRTLRAELDALEQRAIGTLKLEQLDRAAFAEVLLETLTAYKHYEHMLFAAQKQTTGAAQDAVLAQLREVQDTLEKLHTKALLYSVEVPESE